MCLYIGKGTTRVMFCYQTDGRITGDWGGGGGGGQGWRGEG